MLVQTQPHACARCAIYDSQDLRDDLMHCRAPVALAVSAPLIICTNNRLLLRRSKTVR
jgi:hypothetical protein